MGIVVTYGLAAFASLLIFGSLIYLWKDAVHEFLRKIVSDTAFFKRVEGWLLVVPHSFFLFALLWSVLGLFFLGYENYSWSLNHKDYLFDFWESMAFLLAPFQMLFWAPTELFWNVVAGMKGVEWVRVANPSHYVVFYRAFVALLLDFLIWKPLPFENWIADSLEKIRVVGWILAKIFLFFVYVGTFLAFFFLFSFETSYAPISKNIGLDQVATVMPLYLGESELQSSDDVQNVHDMNEARQDSLEDAQKTLLSTDSLDLTKDKKEGYDGPKNPLNTLTTETNGTGETKTETNGTGETKTETNGTGETKTKTNGTEDSGGFPWGWLLFVFFLLIAGGGGYWAYGKGYFDPLLSKIANMHENYSKPLVHPKDEDGKHSIAEDDGKETLDENEKVAAAYKRLLDASKNKKAYSQAYADYSMVGNDLIKRYASDEKAKRQALTDLKEMYSAILPKE